MFLHLDYRLGHRKATPWINVKNESGSLLCNPLQSRWSLIKRLPFIRFKGGILPLFCYRCRSIKYGMSLYEKVIPWAKGDAASRIETNSKLPLKKRYLVKKDSEGLQAFLILTCPVYPPMPMPFLNLQAEKGLAGKPGFVWLTNDSPGTQDVRVFQYIMKRKKYPKNEKFLLTDIAGRR